MQGVRRLEEVRNRRRLGLAIAALGLVIAVAGAVALAIDGDDEPVAVDGERNPTTTSAEPPTSTTEPTELSPSTSSTTAPPPSTTAPTAAVMAFVDDFVAAIEADDAPFLVESLHPLVVQEFTVELCSSFIEREILTLTDYRRTGDVVGPDERTVLGSPVENFYEAPVSFGFQGQTFDSRATFALVDGAVSWFAECR